MSQSPASPPSPPTGSTQLVLIAVVIAVIAVVLMNVYAELRAKADAERTVTFFELRVDRERGDVLKPKDVRAVQIPRRYLQAFGSDALKEDAGVAGQPAGGFGRAFSVSARKGEILRDSMFIRNTSNRYGLDIKDGNRLVTLPIQTHSQIPVLSPDDFVDIYVNVNQQAVLVMERVQVRLVGRRIVESGDGARRTPNKRYDTITIEVAQDQVQLLENIKRQVTGNTFIVSMRGPSDRELTLAVDPATVSPEIVTILDLDR